VVLHHPLCPVIEVGLHHPRKKERQKSSSARRLRISSTMTCTITFPTHEYGIAFPRHEYGIEHFQGTNMGLNMRYAINTAHSETRLFLFYFIWECRRVQRGQSLWTAAVGRQATVQQVMARLHAPDMLYRCHVLHKCASSRGIGANTSNGIANAGWFKLELNCSIENVTHHP